MGNDLPAPFDSPSWLAIASKTTIRRRQCQLRVSLSIRLYAILLTSFSLCCHKQAANELSIDETKTGALEIEVVPTKSRFGPNEPIDVKIVFHNRGTSDVKVAMCDGPKRILFFEFLIIGDMGTAYLTNNSDGWADPSVKPVRMMHMLPGGTFDVRLENILPIRLYPDLNLFPDERFKMLAIYRDHTYGHSPTYPEYNRNTTSIWKGILISKPVYVHLTPPTTKE